MQKIGLGSISVASTSEQSPHEINIGGHCARVTMTAATFHSFTTKLMYADRPIRTYQRKEGVAERASLIRGVVAMSNDGVALSSILTHHARSITCATGADRR